MGSGKGGGGGQYYLHSGTVDKVKVPIEADRMWIYHTHPGGTPYGSSADIEVLSQLKDAGSPQRSSQVIPVGKSNSVRFGTK
jgi:hypothetical protein